uniref:Ymf69 n=1 Tax=Tetrahymena pigmentosa TaxID=5907 RepID=Q09F17_TETPI|nr:Ymf69 [Tetrahymena pigmentosa]ABI51734.1 Ymf69 [Tetrahymena pigmentosa]
MFNNFLIYENNSRKNNFLKNKIKFNKFFKKYQPLKYYIFLINLFFSYKFNYYILSFNNNNLLKLDLNQLIN